MSASYTQELGDGPEAWLHVEFTTSRRHVIDYSVVLLVAVDAERRVARLYDGAHGRNELHRYGSLTGKQPAEVFHAGTLGEGMRAAIEQVKADYRAMIEGWQIR